MNTNSSGRRFGRTTLVAAAEFLEGHVQAGFNQMAVRLELEREIPEDTGMSVQKKCARLARIVANDPDREIDTLEGRKTLAEAVILEALALAEYESGNRAQMVLEQSLARDGYALHWEEGEEFARSWSGRGGAALISALPQELAADEPNDEVRQILQEKGFERTLGHLNQAVSGHGRGDWAAANSQVRTFVESLVEEIAIDVGVTNAHELTAENRLRALHNLGFLSSERNEWLGDGKGFINGLIKMLHTEGSHPGLSDADHSTFRLHVVLVTARLLLRRLREFRNDDR